MIDLSSYASIGSTLLLELRIDYYKTSAVSTPTSTTLYFSDYYSTLTVDGNNYLGMGRFLGVSNSVSELKSSTGSVSVTLSGIPNLALAEIYYSRIKGAPIDIRRYVFDPTTNQKIDIPGNPAGRFSGFVSNYTIEEQWDQTTRTASNTLLLECTSGQEVLENKSTGRMTNPQSHRSFFPNDPSMDMVPNLVGANFDFGAPQ